MTERIVGEMRQHDQRLFHRHADAAIEATMGRNHTRRKAVHESGDHSLQLGALVLRRGFGARQFAQALRHDFEAFGIAQDVG